MLSLLLVLLYCVCVCALSVRLQAESRRLCACVRVLLDGVHTNLEGFVCSEVDDCKPVPRLHAVNLRRLAQQQAASSSSSSTDSTHKYIIYRNIHDLLRMAGTSYLGTLGCLCWTKRRARAAFDTPRDSNSSYTHTPTHARARTYTQLIMPTRKKKGG